MLTSFWFRILVGAVLGFLSGLGVGGGSLLMLWLTLVLGVAQPQARLMNLMFFLPCGLIACLFRWKRGKINRRITLTAVGFGILGSLLGNFLLSRLDPAMLRKCFGILFILCGIRELSVRAK